MRNWLITGGAGFIGSHFVDLLATTTEDTIIIYDLLTYAGHIENISHLLNRKNIKFIKGDICNLDLVKQTLTQNNIHYIAHFAAESHVDKSILGPQEFLKTNIQGTMTLLDAARQSWNDQFDDKLFLHISTDEVYGSLTHEEKPFHLESQYKPNSPYSASKASSDHFVRAWQKTYGLPTIISNCSNNYGPRQFPEKLIPLMIINAIEGKPLPIYKDGQQIRDWLHVTDHCKALYMMANKRDIGQKYLVGGDNEQKNIDIVHTICDLIDAKLNKGFQSRSLIKFVEDRPGHDFRYSIDYSKTSEALGWQPAVDFKKGLSDMVDWYIDHWNWVESIRSGSYVHYYEKYEDMYCEVR